MHCQRAALYCAVLQVVVSGALDYSRPEVQRDMEELLGRLENTTYIDPLYTESWLRSFLDYVQRWKDYPDYYELNVDDEQSFIKTLKDVSISEPNTVCPLARNSSPDKARLRCEAAAVAASPTATLRAARRSARQHSALRQLVLC